MLTMYNANNTHSIDGVKVQTEKRVRWAMELIVKSTCFFLSNVGCLLVKKKMS